MLRIRIRDPVPFWPLDPGSGIGFFRIPDPKHILLRFNDNFLGRKFYNSLWIGPNFFLRQLKINIIYNFAIFVATKKGRTTKFFSPLSFVAIFGSGIRYPGSEIRDRGSGIRDGQKSGSGIRDKHPGSATLVTPPVYFSLVVLSDLCIVLLFAGNPVVWGSRLIVDVCAPAVVVIVAQPHPGSAVPLHSNTISQQNRRQRSWETDSLLEALSCRSCLAGYMRY